MCPFFLIVSTARNLKLNKTASKWLLACSRLSDSGQKAKEKSTRKVGGRENEKEGPLLKLSPDSSRLIFVFALSQFSGPDVIYVSRHRQPKRTMCGFGLQRSFGRNILELLVYYLMLNKRKNLKDMKSSCLSICTSSL